MRSDLSRALLLVAPLLLGAGAGCGSGLFGRGDDFQYTGYTLVFGLSEDEAVAGSAVVFSAWLIDRDDLPVPGLTWQLDSDLETRLEFGLDRLFPRVAGDHVISLRTTFDGHDYTAEAPLRVVADAPYALDLRLSDRSMPAGGALDWSVALVDAWGNDLDGSSASVTVSDPEIDLGPSTVTSTLPGTYLIEAEWEGFYDNEAFVVVPGPPVGVSLALSATDLELMQTTSATVDVWDAYGNPTTDAWTVSTDRPAAAFVSHRNVTFVAEGWHTVTVEVDGTGLTDSVGPFLIDSTSPDIELTAPERGAWRTTTTTAVTGNVYDEWSPVTDVTVNGASVTPDAQGNFSRNVALDVGVTVIETVAGDLDGNVSEDLRAVLRGTFKPYGQSVARGVQVRLQEGAGGIDTLEAIGEGLIARQDLAALIPTPIGHWKSTSNPCGWFGGSCTVTWYEARLVVENPQIGTTKLDIDPQTGGNLRIDFRVNNPRLTWRATNLVLLEIGFSNQVGTISANYIHVNATTTPYVQNSQIRVPVPPSQNVGVSISNLQFNWSSVLWDILEFFGVDSWIESLIRNAMQNALKDAVRTEAPPAIQSALQDLQLDYPFSLSGRTYTLKARPSGLNIDNLGINLDLGTTVTVDQSTHPGWLGYGSLFNDWSPPTYTSFGPKMNVSFSGDLISQLFYVVWRGGLLDLTRTSDALGLPAADLALLLPQVSTLTVQVKPLLPPVVMPLTSGLSQMELQIGDLELTLFDGPASNNDVLIQAYVTAYAPLRVSAVGDQSLSATIGDPEIYFDVVVPDSNTLAAADTEALMEALVPLILPLLADAIGQIDIPDIQGFGISGISVSRTGAQGGFVKLGGSLYER